MRHVNTTAAFLVLMVISAQPAITVAKDPTPEEIEKIKTAAPAKATAKPEKPHKLLVFTLSRGFRHSSVETAAKAVQIMGEKTGAYTAVVSDDIAMFEPDKLREFDAVCFDNATDDLFLPPNLKDLSPEAQERDAKLKQSLLDFVKGGKGVVGIHAATDCLAQWPEFGELMGGYFDGHPWGADKTVTIKIDEPKHPLNAAFDGKGFEVNDEIYQIKAPYSREKLRVLLSIDTAKTDMTLPGIKRTDGDFAISWVHEFGKGRVFYCSLGHNEHIFWTPAVLRHYLDGIQYALGDLKADATPVAKPAPGKK